MIALSLASLILLVPAAAPPRALKLAAPNLTAVGVDPKKAAAFTDYFAQQLAQYGIRVTTTSEVQALVSRERQREILGCADSSSTCMAELAGALGADGIITGNVGRVEPVGYLLTIKIVAASNAVSMGSYSARVTSENAALDWFAATAREFAKSRGFVKEIHLRGQSWIPAAAGVALAGVGTYLFVQSNNTAAQLSKGLGAAPNQLNSTISAAATQQGIGVALVGVGAAALATAVVFFATGSEASGPSVAALPTSGGAYVALGWRLP